MYFAVALLFSVAYVKCTEPSGNCRDRSIHLRQDGGLCFEIPPWQHQPVELEQHLMRMRHRFGNHTGGRRQTGSHRVVLVNSEVSRYMDTVLAPFLDTYHRNIQKSYQQLTSKILKRIKEEISAAVQKKQLIYSELIELADELKVPAMCDEERRAARTLASKHVAQIYVCTENARASIAKMGTYAEEMITITRNYMKVQLGEIGRTTKETQHNGTDAGSVGSNGRQNVTESLKELSRAAVQLGYELDLSLTNARRHNEQSCESLSTCSSRARRSTDEAVAVLRDDLYQCVYA